MLIATNVEDERKALALGADGYCIKPLSRSTLLDKLNTVVARNVLVIDDDPAARYLLSEAADRPTHARRRGAKTAIAGLLAARAAQPVMIFLDLEPAGQPAAKKCSAAIRRDAVLKSVPVAVVTSRVLVGRRTPSASVNARRPCSEKSELSADRARRILSRGRAVRCIHDVSAPHPQCRRHAVRRATRRPAC